MNKNKKAVKRVFAIMLAATMSMTFASSAFAAGIGAVTTEEQTERETRNSELSMTAATQGMVLLENKENALPIAKDGSIALFGGGVYGTVKGGTGSGDVNQRDVVNVWDGFKNAGYHVTSEAWLNEYKTAYDQASQNVQGLFGQIEIADQEITQEQLEASKNDTDTAVYIIARNSGEAADRTAEEGDYYLTETETKNIKMLAENFEHCIVVLNVGGVMDTSFMEEIDGIDALLLMSQAGMRGGDAAVKVLNGEVTPSGKLTDTWAKNYEDYPSSATFGSNDGNVDQEDYTEGIYVGYRYFDTFGIEPAYEFGYGLSYTTFDITVDSIEADQDNVTVTTTVTNTGDTYSGKEVIEIYFSAPDGELEKPYQELIGYAKTRELAPGESQTLAIAYKTTEMSSYSEERAAYIMEAGDYIVRVGNSSRNTEVAGIVRLDDMAITEQLTNQRTADKEITELSSQEAVPYTYEGEEEEIAAAPVIELSAMEIWTIASESMYEDETVTAYVSDTTEQEYLAKNLPYTLENPYHGEYEEEVYTLSGDFSKTTLKDVYDNKITMEEFVSGLTVSEMADIVIGGNKLPNAQGQSAGATSANANQLSDGTMLGAQANAVSGAAGETAGIYIESKKIPNIVLADGPAGLRLTREEEGEDGNTYYQFCTAWPIGTLLAQTWDIDIVEEVGAAIGEEMREFGITLWLAPGMNIHRNPLCGRNFEYFSEDPYLTGMTAVAEISGVQSNPGVGVTLKHYAGNNQENNRSAVNNTITERTLREIYLKGFEIAVKGAKPMAIMTSYNLNNGVPAADDWDLCMDVARGEWGFDGVIMTDWGGGQSTPSISMHAGNDLIMPGNSVEDITVKGFSDVEPTFAEDDIYPEVEVTIREWGDQKFTETVTAWGEFIPSADGEVTIEKTVSSDVYHSAVRDYAQQGSTEVTTIAVSELIAQLGEAATVTDNGDGTMTIVYKGDYEKNNICLGDLQKSTIHILNIILASNQFADLFEDVEAVSYTETRSDSLTIYQTISNIEE